MSYQAKDPEEPSVHIAEWKMPVWKATHWMTPIVRYAERRKAIAMVTENNPWLPRVLGVGVGWTGENPGDGLRQWSDSAWDQWLHDTAFVNAVWHRSESSFMQIKNHFRGRGDLWMEAECDNTAWLPYECVKHARWRRWGRCWPLWLGKWKVLPDRRAKKLHVNSALRVVQTVLTGSVVTTLKPPSLCPGTEQLSKWTADVGNPVSHWWNVNLQIRRGEGARINPCSNGLRLKTLVRTNV